MGRQGGLGPPYAGLGLGHQLPVRLGLAPVDGPYGPSRGLDGCPAGSQPLLPGPVHRLQLTVGRTAGVGEVASPDLPQAFLAVVGPPPAFRGASSAGTSPRR